MVNIGIAEPYKWKIARQDQLGQEAIVARVKLSYQGGERAI
jgi:hypothetical protein